MKSLEDRMSAANTILAPYAVPHEGTLGRVTLEAPDSTRYPFQQDRDRIVYTKETRRLMGKTQVFVSGESNDHNRTRLTHTAEVVIISRNIARALGLNEDLVECIALAHDLGHPPFGHAGEDALNDWMKDNGSSFEHNKQSLRIVEVLTKHPPLQQGLNPNREVLEGMMKHRTPHDNPEDTIPRNPSLEALVVNIADEIAYTGHDVDDGLREGILKMEDLNQIELIQCAQARKTHASLNSAIVDALVSDLYEETNRQIQEQNIHTLDDVYERSDNPVRFSEQMRKKLDELRHYLKENMYLHADVLKGTEHGKHIVTTLCGHYKNNPNEQILTLQEANGGDLIEAIKDHVAGMTDDYALATFSALPQQQEGA
jgi:dGTPase